MITEDLVRRWHGVLSARTIARFRDEGTGPAWRRDARGIVYDLEDVEAWERKVAGLLRQLGGVLLREEDGPPEHEGDLATEFVAQSKAPSQPHQAPQVQHHRNDGWRGGKRRGRR